MIRVTYNSFLTMNSRVSVKSIQDIKNLKSAIQQFTEQSNSILLKVENQFKETESWLQSRVSYWKSEVERRRQDLLASQAAMQRCQASGYRDPKTGQEYRPSCIYEQQAVELAQARFKAAQAELANAENFYRKLQHAGAQFQVQSQRVKNYNYSEIPVNLSFLQGKIEELERYLQSLQGTTVGYQTSRVVASTTSQVSAYRYNYTALPAGYHMIPLNQINLSDTSVNSPDDFRKVKLEDMLDGLQKLFDVVLPAIENGADGDYFYDLDQKMGLAANNGYKNIYDSFFKIGNDIKVDLVGGIYEVTNGYHRIYAARQLGINALPARILNLPGV